MSPKLRVARATDDIDRLLGFYVAGLGLELLGRFEDHDGFDGAMVGDPDGPYHLEFTCERDAPAAPAPGPESLLVFYLPEPQAYAARVARLRAAGFEPVAAHNPYWDRVGVTFEDPDGGRVVLCARAWAR